MLLIKPSGSSGLAFALEPIPLSLEYIAANLLYKVTGFSEENIMIIDMFKEKKDIMYFLKYFKPDIVGITMSATEHFEGINILKKSKTFNPNIFCIVGGYHPVGIPEVLLEEGFDAVCRTDGELVMVDLVNGIPLHEIKGISFKDPQTKKIIHTPLPERLPDLDSYPYPARRLRRYTYQNLFLRDRVFD
mgnify:CR=1 FL=1